MTKKEWFQQLTIGSAVVLSGATTIAAFIFGGIEAHSETEMHKANNQWRALHHRQGPQQHYHDY